MKNFVMFIFCVLVSLQGFTQKNEETCKIIAPNVVTIDCGGGHDYQFRVRSNCLIQNFELKIYNRWAELLYSSNNIDEYWNASEIPVGTYFCKLQGKYESGIELNEVYSMSVIK